MVRAPYPARIAAGLIVTAVEETRKLPTRLVTLPMTAVSQTFQVGMRAQQNIAELAIKGDILLEHLFERESEQPAWARFDDDFDADDFDADDRGAPDLDGSDRDAPDSDADDLDANDTDANDTDGDKTDAPPVENHIPDSTGANSAPPRQRSNSGDAGRFALYSSAPENIATGADPATENAVPDEDSPAIVARLDYTGLTLAQLRAKLGSVRGPELRELAAYERSNRNRAPFITMLDNRIASQNKRQSTT